MIIILIHFQVFGLFAQIKPIKVEINKNVETLGLIFWLANSQSINTYFEQTPYLIEYYLNKFKKIEQNSLIKRAQALIDSGVLEASETAKLGLYFTSLPDFQQKYDIDFSKYSDNEQNEVLNFLKTVKDFYINARMDSFFTAERNTYTEIQNEIKKCLPDSNYIRILENYHGISMYDYFIIPSIFIPYNMNYGPTIQTEKGIINYYLLGPAQNINVVSFLNTNISYGFEDKVYIEKKGIHEFSHTFMRFIDQEKYSKMISSISNLYTSSLAANMRKIGYGDWNGCFEEHLVRLTEMRIAKLNGDEKLYNQLFDFYSKERGFIYLDKMNQIIVDYEKNRKLYKTFEEFLPIMIDKLKQ